MSIVRHLTMSRFLGARSLFAGKEPDFSRENKKKKHAAMWGEKKQGSKLGSDPWTFML